MAVRLGVRVIGSVVRVMVMVRVSIRVYVMILFCRSIALFSLFYVFCITRFHIIHIPA